MRLFRMLFKRLILGGEMKRKVNIGCLVVIPILVLSACSVQTDVRVEKIEQPVVVKPKPVEKPKVVISKPKGIASKSDLKKLEFMRINQELKGEVSATSLEKVKYIGVDITPDKWNSYLASQQPVYRNLNTKKGVDQILDVLANKVWTVMAENQLVKIGNLNNGVIFGGAVEESKLYAATLDDSFDKAKLAKFKGTKTDWVNYVNSHAEILDKTVKSQSRIDQIKFIASYGAWSFLDGRSAAVDSLVASFKGAKEAGYLGGIENWKSYVAQTDQKKLRSKYPTTPELMHQEVWNALFKLK